MTAMTGAAMRMSSMTTNVHESWVSMSRLLFLLGALLLTARVDADRTSAEASDEQGTTDERNVLHEHRLLHLGELCIFDAPEGVHREGHRDEEDDQQQGAEAGVITRQNAEATEEGEHARGGHQEARHGDAV